jgi:hypothetical protein
LKKGNNTQASRKSNKAAKEKKSRAESPAPKIVSTLISPKFGFDLD